MSWSMKPRAFAVHFFRASVMIFFASSGSSRIARVFHLYSNGKVDRKSTRLLFRSHELVDEAPRLRGPLLQGIGDDLFRLFRVEQDCPRVPPVLERQGRSEEHTSALPIS